MHAGSYTPLSTSFSVHHHAARPDHLTTTNHVTQTHVTSAAHVTSSSPVTSLSSRIGSVLTQFAAGLASGTVTSTSVHISPSCIRSSPSAGVSAPSPAGTDHKPVFVPGHGVLTSSPSCSGPVIGTLSPAVTASSDSDVLANAFKVGPALLDCEMKSEVV